MKYQQMRSESLQGGDRGSNPRRDVSRDQILRDVRNPHGNIGRLLVWSFVGLMSVQLGACGLMTAKPPKDDKLVEMKWPEPPLKTRVQFTANLVSEKELHQGLSLQDSLLQFLSGQPLPVDRVVNPMGIAVSEDGQRVYVTDLSQGRIFIFDVVAKKLSFWTRDDTKLGGPIGIALDAEENVYVADTYQRLVRVFDRQGKTLRTINDPQVQRPTGVAVDRKRGILYVSDTSHQQLPDHYVKAYDLSGRFLRNVGKGKGMFDGYLLFPTYLTLDPEGNVYVADTLNARISVFDPEGNFVKTIGERGNRFGQFERPKGLALDTFGNLYVVDSGWSNVQIFNPKGEVLLFFGGRGRYPGLLNNPGAIAIDRNNRIYVADVQNWRLNVYQLVNTTAEDAMITPDQAAAANAAEVAGKQEVQQTAANN